MSKQNVLILGAGGQIARHVIRLIEDKSNIHLSLFLRQSNQLKKVSTQQQTRIIEGDVFDAGKLNEAVNGQDVVYVNLAGAVDHMAQAIIKAMIAAGVKRLLFVASLGIYNEVPGKFGVWNNSMIGPELKIYRKAADLIEASGLDYTIIRPAWLTDDDEVDYEITRKGEPFKGTEVSRKSVAALIAMLIEHPQTHLKESLGVDKPGTNGDRPSFY